MIGLWVSGFCTAALIANAIEQRWTLAIIMAILAVGNFANGATEIKGGDWS